MMVGSGAYRYRVVERWGKGPEGRNFGGVLPGLAVDSQDRIYMARRKEPAVLVYDREGRYITTWGEEILRSPHGIYVDGADHVWVTDVILHTVLKFSTEGELLAELGTRGTPGAAYEPFNKPTKALTAPNGEIFVSDGYGQFRVHRFSAGGERMTSWGSKGAGPGQFELPHSVAIDGEGRVLICDRENNRIQIFDVNGNYLSQWDSRTWPGIQWPNEIFVTKDGTLYLTEAGYRVSVWKHAKNPEPSPIWSSRGDYDLLARFGDYGDAAGQFASCPHAICVDSQGSIYVAEVPTLPDRVQKFQRV